MYSNSRISGTTLKIIAAVTMLIDHAAVLMLGNGLSTSAYNIMRMIGRISFPLFAYLLVQGFLHTHSFWRYFRRMAIFALISEIPFNLFCNGTVFYLEKNNIMFTFLIALLVLYALLHYTQMGTKGMIFTFLTVTAGMAAAYFLKLDYSWRCILFVSFIYFASKDRVLMYITGSIVLLLSGGITQITAPFAFLFIHFYNGKKGPNAKHLFYIFYPAHLLVLGLIKVLIF